MDNKRNLRQLLNEYDELRIPMIQRSYAQGRSDQEAIRERFLGDIFAALLTDNTLELNFIYGSDHGQRLELLDGQQRITTLFLLHWYIASREDRLDAQLTALLRRFRYETRHTSTDFTSALSGYRYIPAGRELPSATIKNQFRWYFRSFDLDPTVEAMLRMIDAIDAHYMAVKHTPLFDRLDNIIFYKLDLLEFHLGEELYIKMNARGLPLTPFDNFKADLIGYLKAVPQMCETVEYDGHQMPHYMRIATKLDGSWADLLWNDSDQRNIDSDSDDYSAKYFRFFFRYFASSYILRYALTTTSEQMRKDPGYLFFHDLSEKQQTDRYYGFRPYARLLEANPGLAEAMERVLDTLAAHYAQDIKPLLTPPWDEATEWDFFSPERQFTLPRRIVFAAVCEFIEAYESFDIGELRKWLRVVWNVVENTDIDSISPATYLERNLSAIVRGAAKSGCGLYEFLSAYRSTDDEGDRERSKSVQEEIIKARYITGGDGRWLPLFEVAESHPFCRGMVRFFLRDEGDTPEAFCNRLGFISQMFGAEGILPQYASEGGHLLLRAMISRITAWASIDKQYFTDRVEPRNSLRIMLSRPANLVIRDFLCETLDLQTLSDMTRRLQEATQEDSRLDTHAFSPEWSERCRRLHERLYREPNTMEWMQSHGATRIFMRYGNYYAVKLNTMTNILLLETEREAFVRRLIEEEGFTLDGSERNLEGMTQAQDFSNTGLLFGYYVRLFKVARGWTAFVVFSTGCQARISVECSDSETHFLTAVYGDIAATPIEWTMPPRHYVSKEIPYHEGVTYEAIREAIRAALDALPEKEVGGAVSSPRSQAQN